MKKVKGGVLLLLFVGVAFGSRDFLLSPGGKHIAFDPEAKSLPKELTPKIRTQVVPQAYLTADDFKLEWQDGGTPYTFGFDVGDSIGHYMQPLAGAIVKEVFLYNTDFDGKMCFFLNDALYDGEAASPGACVDGAGWVGYYGHVDDNGDTVWSAPGEAEFWVEGDNECFNTPPIGAEIWPALGIGCYTVEFTEADDGTWIELDLAVLGYPDTVWAPFFVTAGIDEEDLTGNSWGIGAWDELELPYHGFKYYNNVSRGEPGWWLRGFGWRIYTMVEYVEDIPPFIEDVTVLPTWLKTDARPVSATITDFDPTLQNPGVDFAKLWYAVNDGDTLEVSMTADADTFSADIPANITSPGDEVEYWVSATDLGGNTSESGHFWYRHYEAVNDWVMMFNGLGDSGYPSLYYFYDAYKECKWCEFTPYDIWAYGKSSSDLLDNYNTVVEITSDGPSANNAEEVKAWLDAGNKNYLLAGDEVVGAYGLKWPGIPVDLDTVTDVAAVPFFEYLGIDTYYGDINYRSQSSDNALPWPVSAIEDDMLSGDLFDAFAAWLPDTAVLLYDPAYEISVSNWLDGFDVDETVTTSMTSMPRPGSGKGGAYDSTATLSIGFYKEDATLNNKVAFLAFDPLSLNSDRPANYVWWGATPYAPHWVALEWFGKFDLAVLNEVAQVPSKFALHQNYPNPFNPVTTINFDIPSDGNVTLTIYNMLGQRVATVVNDFRRAGRHSITWNGTTDLGTAVATGVYLYRIDAGDFSATRKMILLK